MQEDKDLAAADEARKMEIKKLAGEEYANTYEQVVDNLKRSTMAFQNINYINRQMALSSSSTLERLLEVVKAGDMMEAAVVAKDFEATKATYDNKKGTDDSVVISLRRTVTNFLKQFGLDNYVTIDNFMNADAIRRAIDMGYAAKMWELTNRHEKYIKTSGYSEVFFL